MIKKNALTLLGSLLVLLHPASGTILLNEIHINPPPDLDLNYEYIELRSTTGGVESCAGLTLLIIENNGGNVGEVEEALDLSAFSTGPNGLLLLGNGYDGSPAGGPWSGYKATATATADPSSTSSIHSGLGDDDLDPNGGLTFLLVTGWTGMTNATASSLGDADVNNNSTLDWLEATKPAGSQQTQPFTTIVDSIGYRDLAENPVRRPYTSADLNLRTGSAPTYAPDNISRRLGRDEANNTAAWYGGNLAGISPNAITYDTVQFFGDFKGQATPGQPNLGSAPVPGNFLLNEVSINPASIVAGNDANFEFIEIRNTVESNGTFAASLQGYALLLIGSSQGSGNVGKIIEAWDLSSMSTGANGLLLLGDGYPEGRAPWGSYIDPLTQLGEPEAPAVQTPVRYSSMGEDDIGSNNGFTLLLVRGYTGTLDQVVGNASGSFTVQPWTSIVDSVGFDEVDLSGALTMGKSYAGAAKVAPTYTAGGSPKYYAPEHVARKAGNTTANSAAAWYGGQFAARNPYSIGLRNGFFFGGFRGESTPGRPNLSAAPATGAVLLNEVHVNPPTTTDSTEYIEVINPAGGITGMHDLWALVVGNNGPNRGVILKTLDLRGMSTGPNGLAIFADGIEEEINPWVPYLSPQTLREDPASYNDDGSENVGSNFGQNFIEPNDGTSVLLVKSFTGSQNQDLDTNDDGTLDTKPWGELVDSVSFGQAIDPAIPQLAFNGYAPGNLARLTGNTTANAAAAWQGGELAGEQPTSTDYTTNYTGSFRGAASPGRLNHTATPSSMAGILINEININPPGGDGNYEFIELTSTNRQSISTNGYTLLLVDVSGAGVGAVQEAWSLDGLSTGANGLLLTGSGYTTALPWTGANAPAEGTRVGSPLGMDLDDIGGATDNGATTVLLVKGFTGRVGDDLDILDSGTLSTPYKWSELTDSAGIREWDTDLIPPAFSGVVYGLPGAKVDLSKSGYTPDNLSRYYDNLGPNTLAAWYGGDIAGSAGTATTYDAAQRFPLGEFVGAVTPGKPNLTPNEIIDDLGDSDKDGVANIVEIALGMDMSKPDAHLLPVYTTVTVAGTAYSAISFNRPSGGTATNPNKYTVNGVLCTVQFSTDLVTWTDGTQLYGTLDAGGEPPLETATYRANTASHTAGQTAGRSFLRLKVERP